jgi:hypothetical protein
MDQKYKVVRNAVNKETLDVVKGAMIILKDVEYFLNGVPLENKKHFGDSQSPNSFTMYSNMFAESLMLYLKPLIERETCKTLLPTYSYSRIYWQGATLEKHKDRPACEYSISLCIDHDGTPWPIYFDGQETILDSGDLVIYKGCETEHWREPYTGKEQIQTFLHYVDRDGPYRDQALDGRPMLGLVKR